jgi:hypothetical protein
MVTTKAEDLTQSPSTSPRQVGRKTDIAILAALAFLAVALLLPNLGNRYLWQDEAQTALLAKTVLARGVPYGTDGKNFFSQELGAEYGENFIWKWHTWLSFYLVAASFKLFGVNAFAARLPFALLGLATVLLLYAFASSLWEDRITGAVAAAFLLFNVPFLILSRQCRYYSAAAFFSLLGLYAYLRLLKGEKASLLLFIIAGVLLFQTNYLYCAALVASVLVHCLVFHREHLKRVAWGSTAMGAICLPWILWLAGMRYGDRYAESMLDFATRLRIAGDYLWQIHAYMLPAYLLLVPLAIYILERKRSRSPEYSFIHDLPALAIPLFFAAVTWVMLAVASPWGFFRYLAPIIAPLQAIAARWVMEALRLNRALGLLLLALPLILHPLPEYLYELTHDYDGTIEGIVTYLNEHASAGDTVAITYGDMPLKFYTPLRVIGGLTGEDLSPATTADWIILRRQVSSDKDRAVRDYLRRHVDFSHYRKITLPNPDVLFENRESPTEHRYRNAPSHPPVEIFHRIRNHGRKPRPSN